jgi:hypothetical protein
MRGTVQGGQAPYASGDTMMRLFALLLAGLMLAIQPLHASMVTPPFCKAVIELTAPKKGKVIAMTALASGTCPAIKTGVALKSLSGVAEGEEYLKQKGNRLYFSIHSGSAMGPNGPVTYMEWTLEFVQLAEELAESPQPVISPSLTYEVKRAGK